MAARGRGADSGGVCHGQAAHTVPGGGGTSGSAAREVPAKKRAEQKQARRRRIYTRLSIGQAATSVPGGGGTRGSAAREVPAKSTARAPPRHAEQKHGEAAHHITGASPAPNPAATRGAKLLGYLRSPDQLVDRKIISIPDAGVVVPLASIRRFVEPSESNSAYTYSNVVDAYVTLLQHRGRPSDVLDNRKVLILKWSWQAWLEDINNTPVSQQELQDTGNNFLQHDMVFIPFLYEKHWFLVVINFHKGEYQVLDSRPRHGGYKRALSKLRQGVEECIFAAQANGNKKGGDILDITKWPIRIIKRLPRQTDGTSCGMFMLKYMQLWNGKKLLENFSQDNIASIKEEIAVDLVFSELNTMDDVQAEIMKWNAVN
ncbi:hypothetical protein ACP70R_022421 [Stipagrostis hirtigluma subsp. patula]